MAPMVSAGVGVSKHRNPHIAGREAAAEALRSAGLDRCDFVLLFATVGYEPKALLASVRDATAGAPLVGCSGEGVIAHGVSDESSHAVVVLAWRSDEVRMKPVCARDLPSREAGAALASALAPLPDDARALFLFPDGLVCDFDALRDGLEAALGGRRLPILGGMAGDSMQMKKTYQFFHGEVLSGAVTGMLLSGPSQVLYGISHGCSLASGEHTITRAVGNVVYEIDQQPVFDLLAGYFDDPAELTDPNRAIVNLVFAFRADSEPGGDESHYVRFLPVKLPEQGAVAISSHVRVGTKVWVAKRDAAKVLHGVEVMAERMRRDLGEQPPRAVLHFDCAGRGRAMFREQEKQEFLQALQQRIAPSAPWIGFHSYGELAPVEQRNLLHNFTAVVTVVR